MQQPLKGVGGGPPKSPLHMALEAVLKVERGKVMSGPNDSVGVLLWNVDVSISQSLLRRCSARTNKRFEPIVYHLIY
jgi:hypothetical protein